MYDVEKRILKIKMDGLEEIKNKLSEETEQLLSKYDMKNKLNKFDFQNLKIDICQLALGFTREELEKLIK